MPRKPTIEELQNQLDELQSQVENLVIKEPKPLNPKPFTDIRTDAWRKINKLRLGNIEGISKARAYRATSYQTISNTTVTKVQLNAETYDTQDEFDSTTNYRLTATKPGYYLVTGMVTYVTPVADKIYYAIIRRNGTTVSQSIQQASNTGAVSALVLEVVHLDAGDYLELFTYHTAGGDETIEKQVWATFMTINQIS